MSLDPDTYTFRDQVYRQLIFHRVKMQGFVPEKQSELYVSKIPDTANIFDLFHFFAKVGGIFQVKLMMRNESSNRGFAFVTYFNKSIAGEATNSLNKVPFVKDNYYLSIKTSLDNCRLFLEGFPVEKSKLEISTELKRIYPKARIMDVIIVHGNYSYEYFNKDFLVYVEFSTHEEASRYRVKINQQRLVLFGNPIRATWAAHLKEPGEEEFISKVKILFVDNLDVSQSPDQFTRLVHQFINSDFVEHISKFRNFAYIYLITHEHANELLKKLEAFFEETLVEVRFCTPPNKLAAENYIAPNLSEADTPSSSSLEYEKDVLDDLENMVNSMIEHLLDDS